jgi:hypothetical protein
VRTTEPVAKSAFTPKTGLFALLGGLLRVKGSGAPSPDLHARGVYGLRVPLAAVALCASLLALTATPALAKRVRVFTGSFGAAGSTTINPYPLAEDPWSAAVDDSTGDVYVTDGENNRIEEFGPSGEFVLMFGKDVNPAGVSEAEQNVCKAGSLVCKAGTAGSTPGAFEGALMYVAVDNSSGPSQNDVYVGDGRDGLVTKFTEKGEVVSTWGTGGQLAGTGIETFGGIYGIAVDTSGNLWVEGGNVGVARFKQDATFVTSWHPQYELGNRGFAVDSEDNVYINIRYAAKYDSAGNLIGLIAGGVSGLTVDSSTGDLYVDAGGSLLRFEPSCQIRPFGQGCVPAESLSSSHITYVNGGGLAINPKSPNESETIYIPEVDGEVTAFSFVNVPEVSTVKASGFTATGATLNGTVNPAGEPVTECFFEWGKTESYGNKAPCEHPDAGELSGSSPVEVHATIADLQPGETYHFRLVAANANNVNGITDEPSYGQDLFFGPPLLESEFVSSVTATSATFEARVNPNNVDTHVRFEYGTDTGYGQATPEVDIGSGAVEESVGPQVQGLAPDTVYHYRVVVHSVLGVVKGEDRTFTTQPAGSTGGSTLLDNRQWELVSPPNKRGAVIEEIADEENFAIRASAAGGAMAYQTAAPTEAQPAGSPDFSQVLSRRTPSGWVSKDITLPAIQPTGVTIFSYQAYRDFSPDLSLSVVQPFGPLNPALSAEATEPTAYLHTNFSGGDPGEFCTSGCFRPLVTAANVPEGTKFGESGEHCPPVCGPEFDAATPDLSHIVLEAPPLGTVEWSAGKLTSIPFAPGPRHGMSNDGLRISNGGEMFDVATGQTLQLDAAEPECVNEGKCTSGGGGFQIASSEGSRVFFTDGNQLTKDAGSNNLYECEISEVEGKLECKLTDLTPESSIEGVIGASEDGSYVYFVVGGNELEAYHDGTTKLIADLNGEDSHDWEGLPNMTARVSPDGRWLAFMSDRELTGYDNHDAVSGRPDEEVYLYHAAGGGEAGSFVCASCDPTGARPRGVVQDGEQTLVGIDQIWSNQQGIAANVPGWSVGHEIASDSPYQSRYLSNGGRLFFNSSDALVPQDANGTEDVYEYEPAVGAGGGLESESEAPVGDTCTTESPTYNHRSGGCVGLISSGTSPEESAFLDASESGADVFFVTGAELAPQDLDSALDVYDAHACSSESPCSPPPPAPPVECQGDSCQSPVQAPNDPTPGSLSFNGPGNLAPAIAPPTKKATTKKTVKCKKGFTKNKKGKCVKKSKKKSKAKKSTHRKGSN